jgi:hypothetical protein
MKVILTKENNFYYLIQDGRIVADLDGHPLKSITGKLSKQNCDLLFGVVDVEKLAKEDADLRFSEQGQEDSWLARNTGIVWGFNKAMELNRFTLEDMRKAYYVGYEDGKSGATFFQQLIQSLQQPTEIEVEIVMETCSMNPFDLDCNEIIERPKLDKNGCLILKRK